MDKIKAKHLKITERQKDIIVLLILLIGILFLIYPLRYKYYDNEKKNETPINELDKYTLKYASEGKLLSSIIYENRYLNFAYENNFVVTSHFVDLKTDKETNIYGFIKKEYNNLFDQKIKELLEEKYPLKKALEIIDFHKEYVFYNDFLKIYFYDELKRSYTLNISYTEIKDYLVFEMPLVKEIERESGYNYDPSKVSVAFTFDDGPNGEKTKAIVDALEEYKMSATFFIVASKIESDIETVKYVAQSHSEIGYHSLNHSYLTKQKVEVIKEEYNYANELLKKYTNLEFKLTRPPYGAYNKKTLQAIDNAFIRWNIDTNDWRYKDKEYIKNHVLNNIKDGNIILFHDTYQTTVEAIQELLPILYEQNIQVLSVSNLAKLKNISLENHEVYFNFN